MTKNLAWHQAFRAAVLSAFNGKTVHDAAISCANVAVPDGDEPSTPTEEELTRWREAAIKWRIKSRKWELDRDLAHDRAEKLAALVTQHREGMQALADVLWFADDKTRPSLDGEVGEAWRLLIDRLTEVLKGGLREIEHAQDDAATHAAVAEARRG